MDALEQKGLENLNILLAGIVTNVFLRNEKILKPKQDNR